MNQLELVRVEESLRNWSRRSLRAVENWRKSTRVDENWRELTRELKSIVETWLVRVFRMKENRQTLTKIEKTSREFTECVMFNYCFKLNSNFKCSVKKIRPKLICFYHLKGDHLDRVISFCFVVHYHCKVWKELLTLYRNFFSERQSTKYQTVPLLWLDGW